MQVKLDTKEKFHVITVNQTTFSADMTEDLSDFLLSYLHNDVKNVVLNLKELQTIDNKSAETLVKVQQKFYESNASFLICNLQPQIEQFLDDVGLLELINVTSTESEAWDIVQMEEIERELMDGEG
ncbi:MAG: STAS domain-containing protein [Bacteroidota bacterium]|nr:STAS domain-containing protein [Bacteroidota bacterium]